MKLKVGLAAIAIVGLVAALMACRLTDDSDAVPPEMTLNTPVPVNGGGPTTAGDEEDAQRETARQFFDRYPIRGYPTFEEAEAIAGYDIPRASADYPVAFGQTTLRWFPQFDTPASVTEYTYLPLAPTSIQVIVSLSEWHGDTKPSRYERATVGGKEGWLYEGEISFFFDFICGETKGQDVWCAVSGPRQIGWDTFEHFVSTLQ